MQKEVFSALHEDYRPENTDLNSIKWFPVLRGKLATTSCIINGSEKSENAGIIKVEAVDGVIFESGLNSELKWSIAPFIRPNAELKVSVLFRVPDFDPAEERLKIEYHRFAAESNAVKEENLSTDCLREWHLERPQAPTPIVETSLASTPQTRAIEATVPTQNTEVSTGALPDQLPEPEHPPILGPFATKSAAINAFRQGDFEQAIELLIKVKDLHPLMWNDAMAQKLGQAYLRLAVKDITPVGSRMDLLEKADFYLRESLRHRDDEYQAIAHYELSKVAYRKFRLTRNDEWMQKAKDEIELAMQLVGETKFLTWLEYLEREE